MRWLEQTAGWAGEAGAGGGGGASTQNQIDITGDHTVTVEEILTGVTYVVAPAGASATLALPAASEWTGRSFFVTNAAAVGSGKTVILNPDGAATLSGDTTVTLNVGDGIRVEAGATDLYAF